MRRAGRRRLLWLLALAFVAIAAAVILLLPAPGQGIASGPAPLAYVGAKACEDCHAEEMQLWQGSVHARAMEKASATSVLGDFGGARVVRGGTAARFYRKADGYYVRAEGKDGRSSEHRVAYAFGVSPLQQYLIEMPGGRYQAFGLAWDSRPRRQGGQRWFSLYPGETIDHRDVLHWTQPSQNWNSQCAECHSTNLVKGYRWPEDRFVTTFSEINVSCEACHGPGSRHVSWAEEARSRGRQASGDPGLVVRFNERRSRSWTMDSERGIAKPSQFLENRIEVEMCSRCHARRGPLTEEYTPGKPLGQTHRPALLEAGLYYADGQMRDEVYEWGSFLQSRMYAAGVTCADCHDAHDLQPKVGRDEVCSSCHQPEKFATRKHHFHRETGRGASCVACHMRSETYMVLQERHDHSLRVPRPDLTVALGAENAPNACSDCHRDRSPAWAARWVKRWFPRGRSGTPHYAFALQAGRTRAVGAEQALVALVRDPKQPAIVRATALSLLPAQLSAASLPALQKAATDPEVLLRLAVASLLEALPPAERLRVGVSLLWDPVRAVRIEAVPAFAEVPDEELESEQRAAFDRSLDEFLLAQRTNAERPEAHVNLGIVYARRGRLDEARRAYEAALRAAPYFVPAYVNLADLLRLEGRDAEGEAVLRRGLQASGSDASLRHALGLLLVRTRRPKQALTELRLAHEQAPAEPRFALVYAVSLDSAGRGEEALAVLRSAQRRNPGARELLLTLATISRDRGSRREALAWARRLAEAAPGDAQARALLAELETGPPRAR